MDAKVTIEVTAARVLSIGHSNHTIEKFVGLLKKRNIKTLVDVRSYPSSKHCPQFDREPLRASLKEEGISYQFMGGALGGMPSDPTLYDREGYVLYGEIAKTEKFQEALRALGEMAQDKPTAVMCSEEDPTTCHRRLLLGRALKALAIGMEHARGDGTEGIEAAPQPIFEFEWRSAKPIKKKGGKR